MLRNNMEILEKRLKFVIEISLFLPVILGAMFSVAQVKEYDPNKITIMWGAWIALLLVDYIFIELNKSKFTQTAAKISNVLLLINVALFAVFLYVNAYVFSKGTVSIFYAIPYKISLYGIMYIPLLILVVLITDLCISDYKITFPPIMKLITRKIKIK